MVTPVVLVDTTSFGFGAVEAVETEAIKVFFDAGSHPLNDAFVVLVTTTARTCRSFIGEFLEIPEALTYLFFTNTVSEGQAPMS